MTWRIRLKCLVSGHDPSFVKLIADEFGLPLDPKFHHIIWKCQRCKKTLPITSSPAKEFIP